MCWSRCLPFDGACAWTVFIAFNLASRASSHATTFVFVTVTFLSICTRIRYDRFVTSEWLIASRPGEIAPHHLKLDEALVLDLTLLLHRAILRVALDDLQDSVTPSNTHEKLHQRVFTPTSAGRPSGRDLSIRYSHHCAVNRSSQ